MSRRGGFGVLLVLAVALVGGTASAKLRLPWAFRTLPADSCGVTGGLVHPNWPTRLDELGVGWLRMPLTWEQVEPRPGELHIAEVVEWCEALHERVPGIHILVTYRMRAERPSHYPEDCERYLDTLSLLLEACGGLVDAWQIENEIDSPSWWGDDIADYELLLSDVRDAAPPGTVLVCAGITSENALLAWQVSRGLVKLGPEAQARLAAVRHLLEYGEYNIADIHLYDLPSTVRARVEWFRRQVPRSKGLWATEVGGPDSRVTPYSDAAQVLDLRERVRGALKGGATRVFWLGLYEGQEQGDTYNQMGLIRGDDVPKPAYYEYQRLIAKGTQ